jgi:hypothetical protein
VFQVPWALDLSFKIHCEGIKESDLKRFVFGDDTVPKVMGHCEAMFMYEI